ncbi:hypothetical protein [Pontibacter pudoricolor]|uniref:hypothetical protein n=1 Tax=Pontibacter pudoricolor TaxID=2694930 RepID=UPI0013915884|nr:hypothetical protein [Pontibacter pudoricolor]
MNSSYNTVQLFRFLELLSFCYPYQVNVIHFRNLLSDTWNHLKGEIYLNLTALEQQNRLIYLNMLRQEIEKKMLQVNADGEQWSEWAYKYDGISSSIFKDREITGQLLVHMEEDHPSRYDVRDYYRPAEKIHTREHSLAHRFYNYTYAYFSTEALDFIEHALTSLQPAGNLQKKTMVKTSLTVAELGFFIRALVEKKVISIPEGKLRALCRAVAESLETKGKKGEQLSVDSLSNKYYSKDPAEAAESVQSKFYELYLYAKETSKKSGV